MRYLVSRLCTGLALRSPGAVKVEPEPETYDANHPAYFSGPYVFESDGDPGDRHGPVWEKARDVLRERGAL